MMTDTVKAKLEKLLGLARQGVGGEAENAEDALKRLLEKNGLTLADIDDESRRLEWFKMRSGTYEKKLFFQLCATMFWHRTSYSSKKRPGWVGVECTKAESEEFKLRYDLYLRDMKLQMQSCYRAFLHVNAIFPTHAEEDPTPKAEIDGEELARIANFAQGIDAVQIRRAITGDWE
jgi:hypothetical protein